MQPKVDPASGHLSGPIATRPAWVHLAQCVVAGGILTAERDLTLVSYIRIILHDLEILYAHDVADMKQEEIPLLTETLQQMSSVFDVNDALDSQIEIQLVTLAMRAFALSTIRGITLSSESYDNFFAFAIAKSSEPLSPASMLRYLSHLPGYKVNPMLQHKFLFFQNIYSKIQVPLKLFSDFVGRQTAMWDLIVIRDHVIPSLMTLDRRDVVSMRITELQPLITKLTQTVEIERVGGIKRKRSTLDSATI